ncbi:DNA/RNA non-specific endonuclease [Streptococcus oralis]|uniref:DNA/RNA non-specific endonuclease n=1 Tax=Streptococcus oralis TaxID=1303 RepID=UPI000A115CC9|nr:DNA/RNA non-specific endonuclease [Streptococcus oralis]ORO66711.1 endonuclease [Streptococcus oralis subsp. oralis]
MKKLLSFSIALLSITTLVACSGHKAESKVPEEKIEQKQIKFDEKLFKEAGLLPFKNEKQLELGELDSKSRATGAHIQLKDSDEPTEKRESKLTYDPVGWHNYKFFYGDGKKEAWLMSRGHLIGYQFSGLNDEKRNLVPMTNWLNAGTYYGADNTNQESMLYYENRLDSWLANHPNYYLDYKVTPIYQKDELIPRQIELQYVGIDENGKLLEIKLGGSKEKVDQYSVTHVVLDNVSANAEINYLDGTAKNTVENEEEKAKKEAEEKEAAEKKAKEEQEKAHQAAQEKEESQESNSQSTNSGGYFRDKNGRWHRPNGKFASKKEIREAGLQW